MTWQCPGGLAFRGLLLDRPHPQYWPRVPGPKVEGKVKGGRGTVMGQEASNQSRRGLLEPPAPAQGEGLVCGRRTGGSGLGAPGREHQPLSMLQAPRAGWRGEWAVALRVLIPLSVCL